MSRHKMVKALDLNEELDVYDGLESDDFNDDLSPEDKEQLRQGTDEVRRTLGPDFPVTSDEIEDSLYYYYYDVPKTVNYLLNQKTKIVKTEPKKPKDTSKLQTQTERSGTTNPRSSINCLTTHTVPFSAAEFFKDCPWLNVPEDRKAPIVIESLYPPGRLLGGSSAQSGGPPKSKLAALAAARRKDNRKASIDTSTANSIKLLEKLNDNRDPIRQKEHPRSSVSEENRKPTTTIFGSKRYPVRQQERSPSPSAKNESTHSQPPAQQDGRSQETQAKRVPTASPSIFAKAIFGPSDGLPARPSLCSPHLKALENEPLTNLDAFAGPSPDDVVLKAQNSSKGAKPAKKSGGKNHDINTGGATQAMKDITITEQALPVKSKNIDVVGEYTKSKPKNAANFVVIGHVDAGKSTLMGRLLHDAKIVDQRTIDKYRKEAERMGKASFALAWVMDQGTEERERGVTIDIANQKFETDRTSFTILDAPGHRDFIPNMIAGASQADFAILVIDASIGNFESGLRGQTKEHALLVRSMGVQRLIVAVNKLDAIQWSEDRFLEISQQISAFLTAAGFLSKNISFVPCSGLTGDNIAHKASDPLAAWYNGDPLIDLLESSEPSTRAVEKDLRLTIDNIFRGGVQNPLSVSGRLDAGTIQIGDSILVMPASQTATVKGIDVDNESTEWAVAGQNLVLHLSDIDAKYLKLGDVICPPSAPVQCVKSFSVKLLAFEHVMPMHCEVHRGRLHVPGRVSKLEAMLDKASGTVIKGKKPKLIKPGSVAKVKVEVEDAVPLEGGSRVILRAEGETIGAGLVE